MNRNTEQSFIWDLDGTLLNSYPEIVASTCSALKKYGIEMDESSILQFTILHSGKELFEKVSAESGVPYNDLQSAYTEFHKKNVNAIRVAANAESILRALADRGSRSFVFTHRDSTAIPTLKRLHLYPCFMEIITMEDGFPRKPAPDAVLYLMDKYELDRGNTWMVGDRQLDMECAANAGIGKILYLPDYSVARPSGIEDFVIRDFMEILRIV